MTTRVEHALAALRSGDFQAAREAFAALTPLERADAEELEQLGWHLSGVRADLVVEDAMRRHREHEQGEGA